MNVSKVGVQVFPGPAKPPKSKANDNREETNPKPPNEQSRLRTVAKVVVIGALLAVGAYYAYPYIPAMTQGLSGAGGSLKTSADVALTYSSQQLAHLTAAITPALSNVGAFFQVQAQSFAASSASYYASLTALASQTMTRTGLLFVQYADKASSFLQWSWTQIPALSGLTTAQKTGLATAVGLTSVLGLVALNKNSSKDNEIDEELENYLKLFEDFPRLPSIGYIAKKFSDQIFRFSKEPGEEPAFLEELSHASLEIYRVMNVQPPITPLSNATQCVNYLLKASESGLTALLEEGFQLNSTQKVLLAVKLKQACQLLRDPRLSISQTGEGETYTAEEHEAYEQLGLLETVVDEAMRRAIDQNEVNAAKNRLRSQKNFFMRKLFPATTPPEQDLLLILTTALYHTSSPVRAAYSVVLQEKNVIARLQTIPAETPIGKTVTQLYTLYQTKAEPQNDLAKRIQELVGNQREFLQDIWLCRKFLRLIPTDLRVTELEAALAQVQLCEEYLRLNMDYRLKYCAPEDQLTQICEAYLDNWDAHKTALKALSLQINLIKKAKQTLLTKYAKSVKGRKLTSAFPLFALVAQRVTRLESQLAGIKGKSNPNFVEFNQLQNNTKKLAKLINGKDKLFAIITSEGFKAANSAAKFGGVKAPQKVSKKFVVHAFLSGLLKAKS